MGVTNKVILYNYLSFVPFSSLEKWYVSYYINPHSIKSSFPIVNLREIIKPVKDKIKEDDYKREFRVVKKISFNDGKIHLRDENTTNMDLYILYPNDLLISKINFHQGAIAINRYEKLVCTTHYQPYLIDRNRVIDNYLVLYLRSKPFQNYIEFLRAEGIKNEATYEFIGSLPIPIPPISIQKRIVNIYSENICKAEKQEIRANKKNENINSYLLDSLGININKDNSHEKMSFIMFSFIDRWAADYLYKISSISSIANAKYPVQKVGHFLLSCQYGISEKATKEQIGIPMLRMNNINNAELSIDALKYIHLSNEQKKNIVLQKGDLLFNRTNSKELVGKTAVFDLDKEFTFASYLIRLKLDPKKVNVHFINYLFNSPIGRTQIDMISRQVLGQANVNAQELKQFIFPVPPLAVQNKIIDKILSLKEEARKLKQLAEQNRSEATKEFEEAIFKK